MMKDHNINTSSVLCNTSFNSVFNSGFACKSKIIIMNRSFLLCNDITHTSGVMV